MKFLLSCLMCWSVTFAIAQEITVSGTVSNLQTNEPIAGAQIKVLESGATTFSSQTGEFKISVKDGYENLVISAPGFTDEKIFLQGQTNVTVALRLEKAQDLVQVGFGAQSKEELTSSISAIDEVSPVPLINLEQQNQGTTTGLFVQNSSGKLGGSTTVRVRGGSTLSNSNQPLYVVDGVPLSSGNQSNINPSNIASIEILKDASAAAIYGSRAANGVIIITTKSGTKDNFTFDADYQFGVSQTPKILDLYTPSEYNQQVIELTLRSLSLDAFITKEQLEQWEATGDRTLDLGNGNTVTMPAFYDSLIYDTDWQKEVFQTGLSHRINLSAQGGTENMGVFASLAYNTQEGILIGNKFDRLNGSVSLDSKISSRLSSNLNFNYIYSKDYRLLDDQDLGSPLQAIVLPPSDGYRKEDNYNLIVRKLEYNPLTEINFSDNLAYNNSVIGSLGLTYQISNSLVFDVNGGVDYSHQETERRQGPETREGRNTGRSQYGENQFNNYIFNSWITYTPELGEGHKASFVVGGSYQKSTTESSFRVANVNSIAQLKQLPEGDPLLSDIDIPNGISVFVSSFGRFNYSLREKYIFQLSGRVDGSSKFGEANRYGFFPAASGGWILTNEPFLQNVQLISLLKLKASYGLIGNVPLDDFLYRANYYTVPYAGSDGLRVSNLANPDLRWETTTQLDLGLEFGITDRVNGSFDFYIKNTSDLLFPVPVSQTSGFGSVLKNVGSMENKGIEFSISSQNVQSGDFGWSTDFNLSANRNTITDLNGSNLIVGVNAFLENEAAGVFYLRKYVGVDTNTGEALYDNGFGGTTTDWEAAPRMVAGNPNPEFFGGLINTFTYKNFDLSAMIQFVTGVDIYNATNEFLANSGILNLSQLSTQTDRWYAPGDNAKYPVFDPFQENTNPSTRFLEDGSYARLKNVVLTYHLPAAKVSAMKMTYFDVYVGGSNLFTLTKYTGYDPDVNYVDPLDGVIGQNISRGIDNFTAPQARIFMGGIKIGF